MNVRDEIYQALRKLTSQKIKDETSIAEIGIDSFDLMILITDAEEKFNIKISDESLKNIKNVADVIHAFEEQLTK